jgi:hypothetical protein
MPYVVSDQLWLRFGWACRRTEHFIQLHLPVFSLPFLEAVAAEELRLGRWLKVGGEILPAFRLLAEWGIPVKARRSLTLFLPNCSCQG